MLARMKNAVRRLWKDESGAELMEYIVVIVFAAVLIGVVTAIFLGLKEKAEDAGKIIDQIGMPGTDPTDPS